VRDDGNLMTFERFLAERLARTAGSVASAPPPGARS